VSSKRINASQLENKRNNSRRACHTIIKGYHNPFFSPEFNKELKSIIYCIAYLRRIGQVTHGYVQKVSKDACQCFDAIS
jgi:hypothetical protein